MRYIAIGASETLPFGISAKEGYPQLVSGRCAYTLTTVAIFGRSALFDTSPPNVKSSDIVSIFIGPADVVEWREGDVRGVERRLARLKGARRVTVVLSPALDEVPALRDASRELLNKQQRLDDIITELAKSRASIVVARLPNGNETDFLPDGLHPSIAGHRGIAKEIETSLGALCGRIGD